MDEVTRRAAVTAAAAGAAGAAAMIGSEANAQDAKMSGSQRLMAGGHTLEVRPLDTEALTKLVNHLSENQVVWQNWLVKGIPAIDTYIGRFTATPGQTAAILEYVLRPSALRPNIIIFPFGIPPVIDGYEVSLEVNG